MIMRKRLSKKKERKTRNEDRRKMNTQRKNCKKNLPGAFPQKKSQGSTSFPRRRLAPTIDEWHQTAAPHHQPKADHQKQAEERKKTAEVKKP